MAKKTLAIIGAGDLGIQIAQYALKGNQYEKVVFLDDFATKTILSAIPIIGKTEEAENFFKQKLFDEIIVGIGYKHLDKRKFFYEKYHNNIPFGTIVHPTSWIAPSAKIEEGCVIYPSCSIDINVCIGANSILNNGCTISHDTQVGKHCFLSPRVALAGFVKVGSLSNIGINATLIDNIIIPEKTRLGGGTVVVKSIEKQGLYVGNPARFIK